jgi:prepilin-type N-terminal cleavage/methylation domain-containing protein
MADREKGFTLIELMIVIAIIAIIAAIAIPNLREGQRNANETAAITSLRQYLSAQGIYHRTDYDLDGAKEYAQRLYMLYDYDGAGGPAEPIRLIDLPMARAEYTAGYITQGPRSGFYFADHVQGKSGIAFSSDADGDGFLDGFGLTAFPSKYNRTGLKTFVIDTEGTVYENILPNLDFDNQAGLPIGWPDLDGEKWTVIDH